MSNKKKIDEKEGVKMSIIRNVRGGTVGLKEEDRIEIASLLIKAGYTVKIGYREIPGDKKGKKEYIIEYYENINGLEENR